MGMWRDFLVMLLFDPNSQLLLYWLRLDVSDSKVRRPWNREESYL
jgi:hypothetical protein